MFETKNTLFSTRSIFIILNQIVEFQSKKFMRYLGQLLGSHTGIEYLTSDKDNLRCNHFNKKENYYDFF